MKPEIYNPNTGEIRSIPIAPRENPTPWKVKVLCDDGEIRTATYTSEADTFFSRPARVKANGKTVTGFVTCDGDWECGYVYLFRAYKYNKNHAAIPVEGWLLQWSGTYIG